MEKVEENDEMLNFQSVNNEKIKNDKSSFQGKLKLQRSEKIETKKDEKINKMGEKHIGIALKNNYK